MTLLPIPGFQHQDPEVGTTAGKPPVFQGPCTRHFRGNFNEGSSVVPPHPRSSPDPSMYRSSAALRPAFRCQWRV